MKLTKREQIGKSSKKQEGIDLKKPTIEGWKEKIKNLKISQRVIARRANISETAFSLILKGKTSTNPQNATVIAVSKAIEYFESQYRNCSGCNSKL